MDVHKILQHLFQTPGKRMLAVQHGVAPRFGITLEFPCGKLASPDGLIGGDDVAIDAGLEAFVTTTAAVDSIRRSRSSKPGCAFRILFQRPQFFPKLLGF